MSNGRSAFPGRHAAQPARHRRGVAGVLGAIAVSGLILGGLAGPVVADDVTGAGNVDASVEVQDDCVTVGAGTNGAGGSGDQQEGGAPSRRDVNTAGSGDVEVSVCPGDHERTVDDLLAAVPDEVGDTLPEDIGDAVPDDPGDVLPGDPGDVLPGDPGDVLPGDPGDVLPGDPGDVLPGDPGDALPGDPGDALPGNPGQLLPDGSGLDPDLVDRLARILPGPAGTGEPGGSQADRPATVTPGTGSAAPSGAVGGAEQALAAPEDLIFGGGMELMAPAPAGTSSAVPTGATLPRTGGGPGIPLLRFLAFAAAGRGLFRLARRRAGGQS